MNKRTVTIEFELVDDSSSNDEDLADRLVAFRLLGMTHVPVLFVE